MKKVVQEKTAEKPKRRISSEVWMWVYVVSLAAVMFLDVYLSGGPLLGKLFPLVTTYSYVFVSLLLWKDAGDPGKWWPCTPRFLMACLLSIMVLTNVGYVLFGPLHH